MTNLEKCLMCFSPTPTNLNNLQQEMSTSSKLYKICCKYLHSIVTKRNSDNCDSGSFGDNQNWFLLCQNCCDSAIKLADLANQLEFYQDCVSESILLFSLGILNRRSQFSPVNRNAGKIIGIDATNLPDCHFPSNIKSEPVSELQIVEVESNLEISRNSISSNSNVMLREKDEKIEICHVDPNNICSENSHNTKNSKAGDGDNIEINSAIKLGSGKLSPILKLPRMQIQPDGNKITAIDYRKNIDKYYKCGMISGVQKILKSEWNRTGSENSFTATNELSGVLQQKSISTGEISSVGKNLRKQAFSVKKRSTESLAVNVDNGGTSCILSGPDKDPKKYFQCSLCKKFLSSRSRLIKHKRRLHSHLKVSTPTSVKCPICGKSFRSKQYLKYFHSNIHTGEKPYRCNICEKAFAHLSSYKTHSYIHASDKQRPYQCLICEKGFATKHSLEIHSNSKRHKISSVDVKSISAGRKLKARTPKKIIKGKALKPYQCQLCENTFSSSMLLETHQRHIHDNVKPFQCNVCEKSFVAKHNLELHSRIHKNQKDYKCDECPYEATRIDRIKLHKLHIHSNVRSFKCRECGKLFIALWMAKRHYKKCHFALEFNEDCIINVASNPQVSLL